MTFNNIDVNQTQCRKVVGLALGGGVVRGLAHIGVLTVLEQEGIPINLVAGSSVGSVIGAVYSAGIKLDRLVEFSRQINWLKIASPVWPVRGLVSFQRLERLLIGEIGDVTFADLKLPYAAVATDLHTGEMVAINHGRVAPAVRASCSVPGIVEPALIDGRVLVDGNYSNSTPVSVVREMGAEYVIGVDIFTPTLRDYLGPIGYAIAGFEILVQAAGGGIATADCLISPDLKGKTYLRFSKREQLLELGKEAAREKLPTILEALNLDGNVISQTISN